MGDPKRDKPQDRKKEQTVPDRGAPLPSITAPKFGGAGPPAPEVSVTADVTAPGPALGEEERTNTEAAPQAAPKAAPKTAPKKVELDPSKYVTSDVDELASEFQGGGKE